MSQRSSQVAESSFSFLHMELVQMALEQTGSAPSTAQLQHASRKVEAIGFEVGVRLVERYTKDRPRFTDTLEIIKFLCKDFWMEVYRKQIDKLQTNNRVRTVDNNLRHEYNCDCLSKERANSSRPCASRHRAMHPYPLPCATPPPEICARRASTCCRTIPTPCSRAARRHRRGRRLRSSSPRYTLNSRAVSSAARYRAWAWSRRSRPR